MAQNSNTRPSHSNDEDQEQSSRATCLLLIALLLLALALICLFGMAGVINMPTSGGGQGSAQSTAPQHQPGGPTPEAQSPGQQASDDDATAVGQLPTAAPPSPNRATPTPIPPLNFSPESDLPAPEIIPGTDFSFFQNCAVSIHYPRPVNDHWDAWDLSLYISNNATNLAHTAACDALININADQPIGILMQQLTDNWWQANPFESPPKFESCKSLEQCAVICTSDSDYPYNAQDHYDLNAYVSETQANLSASCLDFQNMLLEQDVQLLAEQETPNRQQAACLGGVLPGSLCQIPLPDSSLETCATSLGLPQSISGQDLFVQIREKYALSYGDISGACVNYLQLEFSRQQALQDFNMSINQTAACLRDKSNCQFTPLPDISAYQDAVAQCAAAINWTHPTNTPAEQQALLEYLIIAAPWDATAPLPNACNTLLTSILVNNDLGTQYWLVLGETIADKQK